MHLQTDTCRVRARKTLTRLSPKTAKYWSAPGCSLRELRNFDEATWYYRKTLKINPEFEDAYYGFSRLLIKKERYSEARELMREALVLNEKSASAYYLLSLIEKGAGNSERSSQYMDEARAIVPDIVERVGE